MKTPIKKTKKIITKKQPLAYKISVSYNGTNSVCETDDLVKTILDMKPVVLKTRVDIIIEKGLQKAQKTIFIPEARKVFSNKLSTQFFVSNLTKRLA